MVRDAGEGYLIALAHLPRGQHNFQLSGGDAGVLVEGLIEVAEAEEDDGVGVLLFNAKILAADGGDIIFHGKTIVADLS